MINRPHLLFNMNGPPKFEVGLRPIAKENWLLPDDGDSWIPQKNELLNNCLSDVFVADLKSKAAQSELYELIAQDLGAKMNFDEAPLVAASRLVSDDLIIMDKYENAWAVVAATLCSPTFFNAQYAFGKSLEFLHGPVPTGNLALAARIERIFDNLAPDMVLERFNWTVQWSDRRYTPNGATLRDMAQLADVAEAAENLFERVERQTIRVLPKTRAIVFTIRIRINKLTDMIKDAAAFDAFENAWTNAPDEVRDYKKWAPLERHVAHILKTKFLK